MSWEQQLDDIFSRMKEYEDLLHRPIVMDDILKLVEKPVRKISKFDTKILDEKIYAIERQIAEVKDHIANLTQYTVDWFNSLKKKYGKDFPRRTEITSLETIAATKVVNNNAKLYANYEEGFVGIGLKSGDNPTYVSECSDLSEIIVIGKDGRYRITKVSDKAFFGKDLLYVGVFNRGDERTIYNVIYRDGKTSIYYAKRFNITSVTRDKEYDVTTGKPGSQIVWFTVNHNGEAETVKINLRPKPKLKKTQLDYDFSTLAIKGKGSRGNLVTKNVIQRISMRSKGVSTIGGKDIWWDADIQRLNEDGRGIHLGQFSGEDKVLAVFKDGTYYTTSYDLLNKYQGEVILIEKLDVGKTFTALYWDGSVKAFYIKRFSFSESDNTPVSFISDGKGSYLVAISCDKHPRVLLTFGGKYAHREEEIIEAEEFIAKKGITAKGKKCHAYDLKKVAFTDPIPDEEPEETPAEPAEVPDYEDDGVDVIEVPDVEPIEQDSQASKLLEEQKEGGDEDEEPIDLTLF